LCIGIIDPRVQASGKTPVASILLNMYVMNPAKMSLASIKYSFKSLSSPVALHFLRDFIALRTSL